MEVADLLLMQAKLRDCQSLSEISHLVVNESTKLLNYDVAVLVGHSTRREILAISGLPEAVPHTPFSDWLEQLVKEPAFQLTQKSRVFTPADVSLEIAAVWHEYLPANLLCCRLTDGKYLILARSESWSDEETLIADYWSAAVSHAIWASRPSTASKLRANIFRARNVLALLAVSLVAMVIVPTVQTITASAEIVPLNPAIIRSPMDAVIDQVNIEPNQSVDAGELLISLDKRDVQTRYSVVAQDLEIAKAEYRRANQAAIGDNTSASSLPALRARISQQETELEYMRSLLQQATLTASQSGIAIVDDPVSLLGKPVKIGQQLMMVASPGSVEIEFWVAIEDSITIPPASRVNFYPNVRPDQPYGGEVRYINYRAEVSPAGILGFRGRAALEGADTMPRLGWRGTLKIEGSEVSLFYFLFRRPIATARQWMGI